MVLWLGQPLWHQWRRDQALAQARQFTAQKDYRSSLLALRRASELDLGNPAVWQEIAELLSSLGSPEALVARSNLVALTPEDMSLRLALVLDALRFGATDTAREAIAAVSEAGRREVDFYRMAAALSYAIGEYKQFQDQLAEVVRRAPDDRDARFNLAALRLWGTDLGQRLTAAAELRELTRYRETRVRAAIELLKFTANTGVRAEADELVTFLCARFLGQPLRPLVGATIADEPPGWAALLEALREDAGSRAQDATTLVRWLGALGMRREALVWLDGRPAAVQQAPTVWLATFDLALASDDQSRLRTLLGAEYGARMPAPAIDLAFAVRWQLRNRAEVRAHATWDDAISVCADSLPALRALVQLATAWNYAEGSEAALRAVIARFPTERWAYEAARLSYLRQRDTERLLQLYKLWMGREPQNRLVQQSWIMLSLLLGQGGEPVQAQARQLRRQYPAEPAVAVCYAAALRSQGRRIEALAVLTQLDPVVQKQSRVALWRAVLAAECGRKAEARAALETVAPQELLEEEAQLWRLAREASLGSAADRKRS